MRNFVLVSGEQWDSWIIFHPQWSLVTVYILVSLQLLGMPPWWKSLEGHNMRKLRIICHCLQYLTMKVDLNVNTTFFSSNIQSYLPISLIPRATPNRHRQPPTPTYTNRQHLSPTLHQSPSCSRFNHHQVLKRQTLQSSYKLVRSCMHAKELVQRWHPRRCL